LNHPVPLGFLILHSPAEPFRNPGLADRQSGRNLVVAHAIGVERLCRLLLVIIGELPAVITVELGSQLELIVRAVTG
jgi:hypothetical protein